MLNRFISLVVPLCLFFSCISDSGKQPYTEEYAYPLAIGNSWTYERTFDLLNYRDLDGNLLNPQSPDTVDSRDSVFVMVNRIDTLPGDSAPCFVLLSNASVAEWYRNCADGLFALAYLNPGGAPWATPKRTHEQTPIAGRLRFKGRNFASLREISDYLLNSAGSAAAFAKSGSAAVDTPTVWAPPRQTLLYPYTVGRLWVLGVAFRMGRQYVGIETVVVPAGRFECYKVKMLWDFDIDGKWDTDTEGCEYISRTGEGLIKRDMYFYGLQQSNENGVDIGSLDAIEKCNLMSYNLP